MVGINPITTKTSYLGPSDLSGKSATCAHVSDRLYSAAPKESFGRCVSRWLCFVPSLVINLITKAIKDVIYVLSFCTLCKEEFNTEEVSNALTEVADVWKRANASPNEKKAAFDGFVAKFPGQKNRMIQELIHKRRDADLGPKNKKLSEAIIKWNEEHSANIRHESEKRLERYDAGMLNSYLEYLCYLETLPTS